MNEDQGQISKKPYKVSMIPYFFIENKKGQFKSLPFKLNFIDFSPMVKG